MVGRSNRWMKMRNWQKKFENMSFYMTNQAKVIQKRNAWKAVELSLGYEEGINKSFYQNKKELI